MPGTAKHLEVSRRLREEIAAGKHRPGARLPSEAQLVKRFGVSRPTVARALLDLQREGLVMRRAGSGTYLCPDNAPPSGPPTRQLGLLIPGLAATEILELICGELAGLARARDFPVLWGGAGPARPGPDPDLGHAEELCRHFIERRVSGVFFAPLELVPGRESANRRLAESLRQAGIPVVLLDRDLEAFPVRSDFDLVGVDNLAGGYLLADHLIRLGCRHLTFVARPGSAPTVDARIAGVREAMVRHRLDPDPDWIRTGDPADIRFVRSLTAARRPDALLCANDHTAALLLRSLESLGLRVPREVRVVGFDDARYATLVTPSLTTVHQPCREIASVAFRMMMERLAEPTLPPRAVALSPRLVLRESCGAYPSRPAPGR